MSVMHNQTQPMTRVDTQPLTRVDRNQPGEGPTGAGSLTIPIRKRTLEEVLLRRHERLVKWSQVITLIFMVLETAIAFRVVLKLIAANPASPFAQFVYQMTGLFLAPFNGLTATPSAAGAVLEVPALIAMAVYGVLCYFIIRFMWVIFDRANPGDAIKYKEDL